MLQGKALPWVHVPVRLVGGGPACGVLACPMDCSGNGKCINGKCLCDAKWMGPGCEEYRCPITNGFMCSNHGTCNNGTCDCDTIKENGKILGGYYGDQTCHLPYCGVHANDTKGCSGHGECVDKICKCEKVSMANTVAKRNAQQIVTAMVSAATMACVSVT